MKQVGKYNLFKALSILITCVPPIAVAMSYGNMFIETSGASMSFAGVLAVLFACLFLKNKIAENFKVPSPFVVATVLFVTILLIEQILIPVKYTCLVTMVCCGVDELTFKRIYKRIELLMPEKHEAYKHLGFYACKTEQLTGETTNEQS